MVSKIQIRNTLGQNYYSQNLTFRNIINVYHKNISPNDLGSSAVGSLDELLDERDDKKDSENEIFYDTEELVVTQRSSEKESTERKKNRKDINISLGDEENKKYKYALLK